MTTGRINQVSFMVAFSIQLAPPVRKEKVSFLSTVATSRIY